MRKTLILGLLTSLAGGAIHAAGVFDPAEPFPQARPQTGHHAGIAPAAHDADGCLTLRIQQLDSATRRTSAQRRADLWLGRNAALALNRRAETIQGIRFHVIPSAAPRFDALPSAVRERRMNTIARGVIAARRTLVAAGLPEIDPAIVLAARGASAGGYALAGTSRREAAIVLDVDGTAEDLLRTAAHQYAHSVALTMSGEAPAVWNEAFAVWATRAALGRRWDADFRAFDERLSRMHEGLASEHVEFAVGNAVWLEFVGSRWGDAAVASTLEELARAESISEGLERGIRRVSTIGLEQAFAEFQLWSLFTGSRDDGRHLPAADRLAAPRFTSSASGLPALSIRQDPGLAPWGWSRVRLLDTPVGRGGLRVDFEGDFSARWQVDLVLTAADGSIHRVPMSVVDGRVELTVPLDGLAEAVLLVRRLDGDPEPKGYSYSAHRESGYPVVLSEIRVEPIGDGGLLVQWETSQEHRVVAFNVLRARAEGGARTRVNPVWIPALGDTDRGVGYRFLDSEAKAGVRYEYTIQAVTETGLTSHSPATPALRN